MSNPVAWAYEFHEFGDVWSRQVILNRPDGGANAPTLHYGNRIRNVTPLYSTQHGNSTRHINIPEGWKMVPILPTKEMILAGKHTIKGCETTFESIIADMVYQSMLNNAPSYK